MSALLLALLLLLVALLGAQFAFARRRAPLAPQLLIASGGPFVLFGFILGPHVTRILSPDIIDKLTPLLALGLGWIGILFGSQLDRDNLRRFPTRYLTLAWLQAVVAFAVFSLLGWLVLIVWLSLDTSAVLLAAAATACISTPAAIALVSNTYTVRGPVSRFLFYVGSLDAAVGIVALGVIHALYYTGATTGGVALRFIEWFAISILLGLLFGTLFLSLTRLRPASQEFMLFLLGLVLFAAGTAFYLSVSPLFVCMIAGIVIANLSPLRQRAYAALSDWEQPIYIMTLVLAGALLNFSSRWIVPLVGAYLVVRIAAKLIGGAVFHFAPEDLTTPKGVGLALVPQGGMTLAMAISFVIIYDPMGPTSAATVRIFLATVVLAVGLADLIGPLLVRGTLRRAGELGEEHFARQQPVRQGR